MTEMIEILCRRLDAAKCVYVLRVVAAGVVQIDVYRTEFYDMAKPIAMAVELEYGCQFEINLRLNHPPGETV